MPGGGLGAALLRWPGRVHPVLQPLDLGEVDAVVLGEKAAHIDAGGLRPFRNADGAALEVLRGFCAAIAAETDRGMGGRGRTRDGKTGIAIMGAAPCEVREIYFPNDSSETSHSGDRVKRNVISSIDGKI